MISPFTFFISMSKNCCCFDLCSIVNFILGVGFYSSLSNSLMSPHGHFHNMKKIIQIYFPDLINFSFTSFPYFLPMISYRFYSKDVRVRLAYVG